MGSFYRRRVIVADRGPFTSDPEHDALVNAMYAVEQREGERHGWDKPPSLWLMYLADIDAGAIRVEPVERRAWRRGEDNPADDLTRVAAEVGQPSVVPAHTRYADTTDGIAAVMFMVECWGTEPGKLTAEHVARQNAGQRVIHTMPACDRIELRSVAAVDVNGLGCTLSRVRGRNKAEPPAVFEPAMMLTEKGAGPGLVLRALFALTVAARQGRWPKP